MSKRILAVDDSKTIQSALEITFHTIDALELSIESKGTRVRKRLQDESFDLLILDYDLPDIEVDELISQLRAVDALANLPILLLAGKSYSSSAAPKSHVDGVLRNRNASGKVQRLPGQHHGDKAKESTFCMAFMRPH